MRYLLVLGIALLVFKTPALGLTANDASDLQKISQERLIFHTNRGDLVAALYPKAAPLHVAQILKLAEAGVFENVPFFRLEPGFVLQISNFNNRKVPLTSSQLALVKKIPGEFNAIPHRRGILSMARFDDPNSAETSFSFIFGHASHLDGKYTVFGELVDGMDVLDHIERLPVDGTKPRDDITLLKTTIVKDGNLSGYKISGPMQYVDPHQPYQTAFKIFAFLAFAITILLPIARTFWDIAGVSKKKSNFG
jgi:cyclophilin family peptidyl-prolyl cis-trans isomerase